MSATPERLPAPGPVVIGVDMGATKILAGLVDPGNQVLFRGKVKTGGDKTPRDVLARMTGAIQICLNYALQNSLSVGGIGVGLPGPLDPDAGIVIEAPNLKDWNNVPVKAELEATLGLPVFIENDANLGTLAEAKLGAARGLPHVVGVFVGSGIGGGLVIDGRLYRGHRNIAGEIGHMIIRKGGKAGGAGIPGTLETNAGRLAIESKIKKRIRMGQKSYLETAVRKRRITSSLLREAILINDPVVTPVMEGTISHLARGLASLYNILDPTAIVLGGGVVEALGDWMLPRLEKQVAPFTVGRGKKEIRLVQAELGDDAILLGAALWARQNLEPGT